MRPMSFVFALALLACSQLASGAEMPEEIIDAVTEGVKIVWAVPGSKPVGFAKTRTAIIDMLIEMSNPLYKADVERDEILARYKEKLQRLLDVSEPFKENCHSIFNEIDALKEEEAENVVNVIPYLETCEQRQNDFCSGRDGKKPNPVGSFFNKIATICTSKDGKKCDNKNKQ